MIPDYEISTVLSDFSDLTSIYHDSDTLTELIALAQFELLVLQNGYNHTVRLRTSEDETPAKEWCEINVGQWYNHRQKFAFVIQKDAALFRLIWG